MDFVHLHLHSEYSLLDGACRIKEIPAMAKSLGQSCVAITDHGVMYGAVDFFKACKAQNIKPIIGCEIYVAKNSRFDKSRQGEQNYSHLVLLCKNETGYKNLIYIVSKAFTEGFYSKPRADLELLSEHSEGLIALSACLGGAIPKFIIDDNPTEAYNYAIKLNEIFGQGNFYLELQNHGLENQAKVNSTLIMMSQALSIPLVATNDVHYLKKEDSESQSVLMCIQTNSLLSDENRMKFETDEFYMKSSEEMYSLFKDVPQAIENTLKIAGMCNFEFDFSKLILPVFNPPDKLSPKDFLYKITYEGLEKRHRDSVSNSCPFDIDAYKKRVEYELSVICSMGYAEYYLIVWDFVSYAKSRGIPVGPGRGSGAGSLVAFCIGITDVDSIKYNLLFERFLNPERVSMPDFDIDFSDERRQEVIDYVSEKYGHDHVSQIVTFGTMAARAAIRDVGRVLGMPYSDVDVIAKLVPNELNITLDRAIENSPELSKLYKEDLRARKLINISKAIEGMPRHASMHAAGIVITDKPVSEYVPLSSNHDTVVTQYTMNSIADLGLLKIDFLGLKYLSIIDRAEREIKKSIPDFSILSIPLDDKKTFGLLSSGNTQGLFQLESGGMRNLMTKLLPKSIEDITAAISLYRPGPMDSIPKYIENRKHPDKIKYIDEKLRPLLCVTFGCIVYQEQVMQIFRDIAGYSYGQADIVRRAMSKKKIEVMQRERVTFVHGKKDESGNYIIDGAVNRGMRESDAEKIYDEMADFAKYAFNKSHAAAYAFVAYRTAYLKANFTKEYMASLLSSSLESSSKINIYIEDCKKMGIPVLPPDINESFVNFTVTDKGIRFGLLAVKNVGEIFIDKLILERQSSGKFQSFEDFITRLSDINKRMLESLIKSGAFDNIGKKRSQLLAVYETALDTLSKQKNKQLEGQMNLFSQDSDTSGRGMLSINYPDMPELPFKDLLIMEKDIAGIYFSGHPLGEYTNAANYLNAISTEDINAYIKDESVLNDNLFTIVGLITSKKIKATKNNARMAFLQFEDMYGSIEVIVFPKIFEQYSGILTIDSVIALTGRISLKETTVGEETTEEPKLILVSATQVMPNSDKIYPRKGNVVSNKKLSEISPKPDPAEKIACLYLKIPSQNSEEFKKSKNLLEIFPGKNPVYIFFTDSGKLIHAKGLDTRINDTASSLLKEYLGEKNVAVKIKNIKEV